jgi:hypothetical protein
MSNLLLMTMSEMKNSCGSVLLITKSKLYSFSLSGQYKYRLGGGGVSCKVADNNDDICFLLFQVPSYMLRLLLIETDARAFR